MILVPFSLPVVFLRNPLTRALGRRHYSYRLVPGSPNDGDIPAKRGAQGMEGSKARKGALLPSGAHQSCCPKSSGHHTDDPTFSPSALTSDHRL